MNQFLSLIKINLKLSMDVVFSGGRRKKKTGFGKIGLILLFVIFGVLMFVSFGAIGISVAEKVIEMNLKNIYISLILLLGLFMGFISAIIVAPSVYFLSNDVETYLSMPLKSGYILGAKFISLVLSQFYLIILFVAPMAFGLLFVDFSITALIGWIIAILFIPVFPSLVASVLMLILMQVAPFLKDKNKLTMLTGLFSIVLGVGYSIFMQSLKIENIKQLLASIMNKGGLLGVIANYLPTLVSSQKMIAAAGIGEFLLHLLIVAGVNIGICTLFLLAGEKLYIRVAQSFGSVSTKSKVLSQGERSNAVQRNSSQFKVLVSRNFKSLFRTPTYFLNGVLSTMLLPIVMIISILFPVIKNGGLPSTINIAGSVYDISLAGIRDFVLLIFSNNYLDQLAYGAAAGMVLGLATGMGGVAATAISRDAKHLDSIKSMPIKASSYFNSHILTSMLINAMGQVIFLIPVILLVPFIPVLYISFFAAIFITTYMLTGIDLMIDILHPSLNWTDEVKAMKGNFNAAIASFLAIGLVALLVFLAFKVAIEIKIFLIIVFAIFSFVSLLLALLFAVKSESMLRRIGD